MDIESNGFRALMLLALLVGLSGIAMGKSLFLKVQMAFQEYNWRRENRILFAGSLSFLAVSIVALLVGIGVYFSWF